MPRFYFHMRDGDHLLKDPDGTDLPDVEAARTEANVSARHLLADRVRAGEIIGGQRFEIVDEAGELHAIVQMRDVLRLA